MSAIAVSTPARPARDALRGAAADLYAHSWRLLVLNAVLSAAAIAVVLATVVISPAAFLALALGPLAAALVHCSLQVVHEDELRLSDALVGLRLHWRRGLALGAIDLAALLVGTVAVRFYLVRGGPGTLLGFTALYLLFVAGVHQLLAWPLALAEPHAPLRRAFATAARMIAERPLSALGLGLGVVAVNAAGIVFALMPFLTLTIAFSSLAAARYAAPRPSPAPEA